MINRFLQDIEGVHGVDIAAADRKNVVSARYIATFDNDTCKGTAMYWSDQAKVYRGRTPDESPFWQLLDELFARQYGFYRPVISHVIRKYLECGDLHQDFARVCCPYCHQEYLLAFSCRGRWFCPSVPRSKCPWGTCKKGYPIR